MEMGSICWEGYFSRHFSVLGVVWIEKQSILKGIWIYCKTIDFGSVLGVVAGKS
jgi:hypothetical protein